jgi:hypothetical protein
MNETTTDRYEAPRIETRSDVSTPLIGLSSNIIIKS